MSRTKSISRASFTSTTSESSEYVKAEIEEEHIVNELLRANLLPARIPSLSDVQQQDLLVSPVLPSNGKVELDTMLGRRSMYDEDDEEEEGRNSLTVTPRKGWVSLCSLQNGSAPVNIEKIIRKTEADEEHLFLDMIKSQKRINDELESIGDSTTQHSHLSDSASATSNSKHSHTCSQGSFRHHLPGSHSCSASVIDEDDDECELN